MRLSRRYSIVLLTLLTACFDAFPAVEGQFQRTLAVSGPVDLDVSTGSGKIDIRAGSSSTVEIRGLIRARDDWHGNAQDKVRYLESNPPIEQSGNTIRIGRIADEAYRNNVSISYEIVCPSETRVVSKTGSGSQKVEGIRGPVDASTGSGSIALYQVGGEVTARTGSGGIELDSVAGRVEANTGSGSIRGERIAGSVSAGTGSGSINLDLTPAESGGMLDVEVNTGSGSIEVSGVTGSLEAETGSGGITVSGSPGGEWKLDASSGGVTLRLPSSAAFDLFAHSGSGTIRVDHPVTITGTISRHERKGKVRGGGHLIDVRTGSGGITIQ